MFPTFDPSALIPQSGGDMSDAPQSRGFAPPSAPRALLPETTDPGGQGGHVAGEVFAGGLVDQPPLGVELLVRAEHQDLGLGQELVNSKAWRSWLWPRAVPVWPGEAPMIPTGLPLSAAFEGGREAQSTAFFMTPGTPWLYSGVTNSTPSAARIAALNAATPAGSPAASTSPL
jgi:hypothetical protein